MQDFMPMLILGSAHQRSNELLVPLKCFMGTAVPPKHCMEYRAVPRILSGRVMRVSCERTKEPCLEAD